jgi:hypothetical protein
LALSKSSSCFKSGETKRGKNEMGQIILCYTPCMYVASSTNLSLSTRISLYEAIRVVIGSIAES